jgi:hypothetical protein
MQAEATVVEGAEEDGVEALLSEGVGVVAPLQQRRA